MNKEERMLELAVEMAAGYPQRGGELSLQFIFSHPAKVLVRTISREEEDDGQVIFEQYLSAADWRRLINKVLRGEVRP